MYFARECNNWGNRSAVKTPIRTAQPLFPSIALNKQLLLLAMTNIGKVFLDSRICKEPQIFDQFDRKYSNIARDIAIWCAWNRSQWVTSFSVPEFGKMFGYNRSHLLRKLTEAEKKALQKAGFGEEFDTVIAMTLAALSQRKLMFNSLTSIEGETKYKGLGLLDEVTTRKSKRGTTFGFTVDPTFLNNCQGGLYQSFNLQDYLNIKTAGGEKRGGQAWDAGRRMFLRLVWKKGVWEKSRKAPGFKPSEDNFADLCSVAGFTSSNQKKRAAELRDLLDKVDQYGGIGMQAEITHRSVYGAAPYEVRFRRSTPQQTVEA